MKEHHAVWIGFWCSNDDDVACGNVEEGDTVEIDDGRLYGFGGDDLVTKVLQLLPARIIAEFPQNQDISLFIRYQHRARHFNMPS
jgi:hypothetical protein